MRRRFGRGRRRSPSESRGAPIDAASWLPRLVEAGCVPVDALEAVGLDDVPASFAALGEGRREDGGAVRVGFAPESGADAALALLALEVRRRAEGAEAGELLAVTSDWSAVARRRLALLRSPLSFDAVASTALAGGTVRVAPEAAPDPPTSDPRALAGRLPAGGEREAFLRALDGLSGLAAKHGGALRARGDRAELVLLAQSVAALVAERSRVRIEVMRPERSTLPLGGGEGLSTVLDRLEGLLRKLLNDRRVRGSEAGLRSALLPLLDRAAELVGRCPWPFGSGDAEPVDWVGVAPDGTAVVGASRERLGIEALAEILDAAARSGDLAWTLAREAALPPPGATPRLVLAAQEFDRAALDVLGILDLDVRLFDAATRRNGEWGLEAREREAVVSARAPRSETGPSRPVPRAEPAPERPREPAAVEAPETPASPAAAPEAARREARDTSDEDAPPARRYEEVSLFDLDDDPRGDETGGAGGRKRRGRGRRRGRRGRGAAAGGERSRGDDGGEAGGGGEAGPREASRESSSRESRRRGSRDDDDADEEEALVGSDDEDTLAPLSAEMVELEEETPTYEDEDDADEGDAEADRARRERELRRRARAAKPETPPPTPRRRAAFVAHADPVSILTAVVLARDVRLVESFWVYPQSELMTFFRNVATDLREGTPIFLVGFAASPPARDTLQAASLYRGRLDWFDHHEWPPEDLEALRDTIGADHVHVTPGTECSLASVIAQRTRRSRFSDKLVELVTGRFTQHDYERWGRLWWHRAHEIAQRPGERRSEIDPLLAGRPSDLARQAAKAPEPPVPAEVAYVSDRDFRIVHFGGLTMAVIEVPESLDLHLVARIARERYEAQLSLATIPGRDLVVLGGDDTRTKRGLDLGGMTAHLASKHEWVEALPDDDHVARMRVRGLHDDTGRFDELITEIAMGRSIVEG